MHDREEQLADCGGGRARQARQKRLGRLLARERVAALLDEGSFTELGRYLRHDHQHSTVLAANRHVGDGLICGLGAIDGRAVAVYAHDPTVLRGSVGEFGARKLCRLLDLALARKLPVVAMVDSDGARILEGIASVQANGEILTRLARLRGHVPMVTLAHGLCVGAGAYAAALSDLVGMVEARSFLFVTGPKVTAVATGESVDIERLGGVSMHTTRSGQCHQAVDDDEAGIAWIKRAMSYLTPRVACDDPIERADDLSALPLAAHRRVYDMGVVLDAVLDRGSMLPTASAFAPNLLTGFARLNGRSVAYLANQPKRAAGALDVHASLKGARHLKLARSWGLPVVTLVDVPGFMPGHVQEAAGLLPFGADLLSAYAQLDTPSVCLVVRKSYGGASLMSFQAQVRLAFPDAVVAPTGVDTLLEVEGHSGEAREQARAMWAAQVGDIWSAAHAGYIDQVVLPSQARQALARALDSLDTL